MKLVELQHRGFKVVFMAMEEVVQYIEGLDPDFLDDPDERDLFSMLFPEQLEYVTEQVNLQVSWKNFWAGIKI